MKNKTESTPVRVVCLVAIIVALIALMAAVVFKPWATPDVNDTRGSSAVTLDGGWDLTEDSASQEGGIKTRSQEEIQEELNKKVEDGMINISMNLNPVFENGESEGNLLIVNEEINRYPQIVEIFLKDTDTLVYRSGGISVGHSVEKGKLLVDLDAGNYPCIAYFNAVNPDTNTLVGRAGAEITITVLR